MSVVWYLICTLGKASANIIGGMETYGEKNENCVYGKLHPGITDEWFSTLSTN